MIFDTAGTAHTQLNFITAGSDKVEGGHDERLSFLRCIEYLMMEPTHQMSVLFDAVLVACLFYDCVSVPLLVFELEENLIEQILIWLSRIIWTLAIPRTFLTGHLNDDGTTEKHPRRVALIYLKGWFCFDAMIVVLDWIATDFGGIFRMLKAQRLARMLKAARIVRVVRIPAIGWNLGQVSHTTSEILTLSIGMVLNAMVFVFVLHCLACLWYGIGTSYGTSDDFTNTWFEPVKLDENDTFGRRYTFAAHWALTHFNDGGTLVYAVNDFERGFSVLTMLFSYLFSAAYVSRITASLTRMQILKSQNTVQFRQLRAFLNNHYVSRELTFRVMTCARYFVEEKSRNQPEREVALLQVLSEPLLIEIHYQMYWHVLVHHPFFRRFNIFEMLTLQRVCHKCVSQTDLVRGDVLFSAGQEPAQPNMYFVQVGSLSYQLRPQSLEKRPDAPVVECKENMWLCEATLWVKWVHKGTASSTSHCKMVALSARNFQKVMGEYRQTIYAVKYAEEFVRKLNESVDDIDDLLDTMDLVAMVTAVFPPMLPGKKALKQTGSFLFHG